MSRRATFAERAARAEQARRAAEQARLERLRVAREDAAAAPPPHSVDAEWADPADDLQTRVPKVVRGRARGAAMRRLHARSDAITRRHLEAALLFQCAWDGARLGYSAAPGVGGGSPGSAGPRRGPGARAQDQEADRRAVSAILDAIGPAARDLLLAVVIEDMQIAAWCEREKQRGGRVLHPKTEFGRLVGILDRLAELCGIPAEREASSPASANVPTTARA